MIKYLFVPLLIALLFSACAKVDYNENPSLKAFEYEDTYIIYALYAEEQGAYKSAAHFYAELYAKSNKDEYLYRELDNLNRAKLSDDVLTKTTFLMEDTDLDERIKLMRYQVIAYINKNDLEMAKSRSLELIEISKSEDDYMLVGDIYVYQKHYDTALKYYERAYALAFNEKILDRLTTVMYLNLDKKKEAIAQLESHNRIHGCSKLICQRLAGYYSKENNAEGMLNTYLRLYEMSKEKMYAQNIVRIYIYQKKFIALRKFLEESGTDNPMLLKIYMEDKNYEKAYKIAYDLYTLTGESVYLGQGGIMQYEAYVDHNISAETLDEVLDALSETSAVNGGALYLNYLGYIMIVHDRDVKAGMEYVKLALKSEPNSGYYLDSLAWGYYKLGECKKAKEIINQVVKLLGSEDEEVKSHIKAINRCIKRK